MLGRWIDKWARGRHRREIENWVDALRGSDDEELGALVAQAADYRHHFLEQGVDVLRPAYEIERDPLLIMKLSRQVEQLQRMGKQAAAPGLMIWVHSFRAMQTPEIRFLGREMWRHLARGHPFTERAAYDLADMTGIELRIDDFDQFPVGLEPTTGAQP
ncbi:MAG: hypothetical protein ACFE0P_00530 [Oceanicaulis sp.]